jgi:hypothetical protein
MSNATNPAMPFELQADDRGSSLSMPLIRR